MNLVMLGAEAAGGASLSDFCTSMSGPLQFVGIILWVFKIAIPIIIVVMGMLDLGKAVTASKDDEIKKAMKQLAIRLVSGVLIFFIPSIVVFLFKIIKDFNAAGSATTFEVCEACLLRPTDEACTDDSALNLN